MTEPTNILQKTVIPRKREDAPAILDTENYAAKLSYKYF